MYRIFLSFWFDFVLILQTLQKMFHVNLSFHLFKVWYIKLRLSVSDLKFMAFLCL